MTTYYTVVINHPNHKITAKTYKTLKGAKKYFSRYENHPCRWCYAKITKTIIK